MSPTEAEVRGVLDTIKDPCSVAMSVPMGLSEMGIVKHIAIADDGAVAIELRLTSPFCEMLAFMRNEAIARIGALPGVAGVSVTHDDGLDWDPDMIAADAQRRRRARLEQLRSMPPRKVDGGTARTGKTVVHAG